MTRPRNWEAWIFASLAVVTTAVFWRALESDFVYWDDDVLIYANPHLRGLDAASFKWMFLETKYVVRYQPLTWLTWFSVYDLFGRGPFGFHLVSLLFHALNTGLVFLLIRKLLFIVFGPDGDETRRRRLLVGSAVAALFWALHPLRVEAVAWVSAFLHCQALGFLLLTTVFYLEAVTTPAGLPRRRKFFWAAVVCFAVSLLSYPIGLGLVVVLVVLDVYPLARFKVSWWDAAARRCWLEKIPFVAAAALVLGITLLLRFNTRAEWGAAASLQDFSPLHRAMQGFYVWAYYLWRPWMPVDLSPVYTTLVRFDPISLPFLASFGLVIAISGLLFWQRRRWPAAAALWVCHLVWLVPVLGLTEHPHYANDRYSLVVGIFWAILAAGLLFKLNPRPASWIAGVALLGGITLGLAVLSARQTGIWRNSVVLFNHMIQKLGSDPYRADIYWRLGIVLQQMDRDDEAIAAFQRVFEVDPRNYIAHRFLGGLFLKRNQLDDAEKHYESALQVHPEDAGLRNNLGLVLMTKGDYARAEKELTEAVKADPNLAAAVANLGVVLEKQGRTNEAKAYLEKARQLQGDASSRAQ